ncbi:hypothetical protein AX282_19735 [Bacillus spizizenii]|nr:hypothetical protein AX282_19735 [Bacillus spizizenii]
MGADAISASAGCPNDKSAENADRLANGFRQAHSSSRRASKEISIINASMMAGKGISRAEHYTLRLSVKPSLDPLMVDSVIGYSMLLL